LSRDTRLAGDRTQSIKWGENEDDRDGRIVCNARDQLPRFDDL
jgi:hypothetical protein